MAFLGTSGVYNVLENKKNKKKIILLNSVLKKTYSDHCSLANFTPRDVEKLILASTDSKNHYSLYFC